MWCAGDAGRCRRAASERSDAGSSGALSLQPPDSAQMFCSKCVKVGLCDGATLELAEATRCAAAALAPAGAMHALSPHHHHAVSPPPSGSILRPHAAAALPVMQVTWSACDRRHTVEPSLRTRLPNAHTLPRRGVFRHTLMVRSWATLTSLASGIVREGGTQESLGGSAAFALALSREARPPGAAAFDRGLRSSIVAQHCCMTSRIPASALYRSGTLKAH